MRVILTFLIVLASLAAAVGQTAPSQKLREAQETAKKGNAGDLAQVLETLRDAIAADRTCESAGSTCSTRETAVGVIVTWIESWANVCQQPASYTADDRRRIAELRGRIEDWGAGYAATAKFTQEGRDRLRRRQDAIYKLENCRSLIWRAPAGPIWVASVAPDVPGYEREHWMVNCGATPYGRWTIMRTEGPAAAAHEILGGVLDLKENGRGDYSLSGIGKSNQRGRYRETGWAELTEVPGAPGTYFLTLRGTWSDRVADGRGGWVAKNFNFGDITLQVERRPEPCPVEQAKQ